MKFQRSADAFLKRFGAETAGWGAESLSELLGAVLPVIVLGNDRTDFERTRWYSWGSALSPGAGFAAQFAIQALTGDVEVIAFGITRTGGTLTLDTAGELSAIVVPGLGPTNSQGRLRSSNVASGGGVGMLASPSNETLWLPFGGLVVPRGFEVIATNASTAQNTQGFAAWRDLDTNR